jgi:hypothetical protein
MESVSNGVAARQLFVALALIIGTGIVLLPVFSQLM